MKTLIALAILGTALAQGQTRYPTTTIVGTIQMCDSTLPFSDLVVQVIGTTRASALDSAGRYQIKWVPIGDCRLRVSSSFYGGLVETTLALREIPNTQVNLSVCPDCSPYNLFRDRIKGELAWGGGWILVRGGYDGESPRDEDLIFEARYGVRYLYPGCIGRPAYCVLLNNRAIFDYLDRRYGKRWRDDVRDDAYGIQDEKGD